jgi:hypothetical protein
MIHDTPALLELLGAIDTPNEAALVAWGNGYLPSCRSIMPAGDGSSEFVMQATRDLQPPDACTWFYETLKLRVTEAGTVEVLENLGEEDVNCRR